MKTLLRVLLLLLVTIASSVPVFGNTETNNTSNDSTKHIESQITPESSSEKIKKLQILFKELKLYSGNIDGKYSSIEKYLIDYQIKAGIVVNKDDWGAGYFGKKTINALKIDFKEEFEKSANKHLKITKPKMGVRYFIVTAYYSPLPGQKKYTTGSHSGDKRLNGEGKVTASGKGVFPGLLAAPRNYKFGTKIYLDGIGIGSVEDRGGAIVNSGERGFSSDRIDIWMGHGDEGLRRALKWGKRKIKGEIILGSYETNIEFEKSPLYKYEDLKVSPNSDGSDINKLQELFTELELYSGEIDGKYKSIKPDLIQFQVDNSVIKSANDEAAGWFGPKTIAAIRQKYTKNIFVKKYKDENSINDYGLSLKKKKKLEGIRDRINSYFNKKMSGNIDKINNIKKRLKIKLDKLIDKQSNTEKRNELKYLNNII